MLVAFFLHNHDLFSLSFKGENGIPREQVNGHNNWLDLETIYGSTKEVNALLREKDEKGNLKCELILEDGYPPLNDKRFNFSYPSRRGGLDNVFATGDLRGSQDFVRHRIT